MKKIIVLLFGVTLFSCSDLLSFKEEKHAHSQCAIPCMYVVIDSLEKDSIYADRVHHAEVYATIISAECDTLYENTIRIKTRGNSTWGQSKKSFSFELPRGTRLFNLPKTKDYILLANVYDESYIRNSIAFDLAHKIGLSAPHYAHIRLYFNNEYIGLYQLTNKIKVGKRSVDIQDLSTQNKMLNPLPLTSYQWFSHGKPREIGQRKGRLLDYNPADITGGYLLDNTGMNRQYERFESGFVSNAGDPVRIRSPKYASLEQVNYIAQFYDNMETAVLNPSGLNHLTHKYFYEYLDVKSFAQYYVVNELLMNEDAGLCSFYMYKDAGDSSKLYAGPIWDFDCSIMSPHLQGIFHSPHEIYAAARMGNFDESHSGNLLYHLCKHSLFKDAVKSVYVEEVYPAIRAMLENGYIDSLKRVVQNEALLDYQRNPSMKRSSSYEKAINTISEFLNERSKFLYWFWTASEEEKICVKVEGNNFAHVPHEREICFYGTQRDGIVLPPLKQNIQYNHDPTIVWYSDLESKQLFVGDTIRTSQVVEIKRISPSWLKVQKRRILKRLHIIAVPLK